MELNYINRQIESVIDRLKELETKDYIAQFGIYSQETSRKIATQLLKELLMKKEKYENIYDDIGIKKRKLFNK
jgi:hypothetical protein